MKLSVIGLTLSLACLGPVTAFAQLQLLPDKAPQSIFGSNARQISAVWHNAGQQTFEGEIQMRIFQATSATAVRLGEQPWKKFQVLPGQTVIESASLDFPTVRAETKFLVQWLENTNRVLGTTEVLVYPTNLLAELKTLVGEDQPVGVFDPGNGLKPLLKTLKVEYEDLEDSGVATFAGKLTIIGPFAAREQMPSDLAERIVKLAGKGTGVVWLRPPPEPHARLNPAFYAVPVGAGTVVVVQATFVTGLANNPQAQLNLLHCCRLARNPEPLSIPDLAP